MSTIFFMPVMLVSIIPVVWGLNIIIRVVGPIVPEYSIKGKYLMLQLVLLVCKIQPAIGDLIYQNVDALRQVKVEYPMTLELYKNSEWIGLQLGIAEECNLNLLYYLSVIISTIILIQMVLLSLGAQGYYRTPKGPMEEEEHTTQSPSPVTNISVIS